MLSVSFNETLYIIYLKKGNCTTEFATKNDKNFYELSNILRNFCISKDFEDRFTLDKIIGKGHFAEVNNFLKKINKGSLGI